MKHLPAAAWTVCALGAMVSASPAQIELRGGESVEAPVLSVSIQGVEVGGDVPQIISWDRVRRVAGEHSEESAPYMQLAEQAWRARTRLARGDVAMAQPIFEELFNHLKGEDGPTALVVAQGLLQCRLASLAQASAVAPWLETVRLRRQTSTKTDESLLIDAATGLAPGLPPVWLDGPAIETLAPQLSELTYDDPKTQRFRALYQIAAQQAIGQRDEPIAAQDEPGLKLVASMISALSDDPKVRTTAQRQLRAGLTREPGGWQEAWRRVALGRSLLLEDSLTLRRQGMIHLLHIPARFQSPQPYLAGVALAIVADELHKEGNDAGADRLIKELTKLNPAHPALGWWKRRPISSRQALRTSTPVTKKTIRKNQHPDATSTQIATDKETP